MAVFLFLRRVSERIITFRKESMPDTLNTLEADRSKLLEEFLRLGDLRPGSITAVVRRCGKPTCHCAKPNDTGHDPQFRLTRRVAGKSLTETFPNPAALRKAQHEVAEFHRFQRLGEDLVSINERICALRPVEKQRGGWSDQEKNGCCNPSGNCAGSKSVVVPHLRPATRQRKHRSGSHRERLAILPPLGWSQSLERTAAVRRTGTG